VSINGQSHPLAVWGFGATQIDVSFVNGIFDYLQPTSCSAWLSFISQPTKINMLTQVLKRFDSVSCRVSTVGP